MSYGLLQIPAVTNLQASLVAGGTLLANTTYYVAVHAADQTHTPPSLSAITNTYAHSPISTVVSITTTATERSIALTWDDAANAGAYDVLASTNAAALTGDGVTASFAQTAISPNNQTPPTYVTSYTITAPPNLAWTPIPDGVPLLYRYGNTQDDWDAICLWLLANYPQFCAPLKATGSEFRLGYSARVCVYDYGRSDGGYSLLFQDKVYHIWGHCYFGGPVYARSVMLLVHNNGYMGNSKLSWNQNAAHRFESALIWGSAAYSNAIRVNANRSLISAYNNLILYHGLPAQAAGLVSQSFYSLISSNATIDLQPRGAPSGTRWNMAVAYIPAQVRGGGGEFLVNGLVDTYGGEVGWMYALALSQISIAVLMPSNVFLDLDYQYDNLRTTDFRTRPHYSPPAAQWPNRTSAFYRSLRVVVLDENGAALPGAQVSLWAQNGENRTIEAADSNFIGTAWPLELVDGLNWSTAQDWNRSEVWFRAAPTNLIAGATYEHCGQRFRAIEQVADNTSPELTPFSISNKTQLKKWRVERIGAMQGWLIKGITNDGLARSADMALTNASGEAYLIGLVHGWTALDGTKYTNDAALSTLEANGAIARFIQTPLTVRVEADGYQTWEAEYSDAMLNLAKTRPLLVIAQLKPLTPPVYIQQSLTTDVTSDAITVNVTPEDNITVEVREWP